MTIDDNPSFFRRVKTFIVGKPHDPTDPHVFHKLSLIAFFAWVGMGADGISSSAYGPEEAFRALGAHGALAVFIAIAIAVTIFVISACYSQIIELFPSGGGGYVVASKLLSPTAGAVSGCALLIDYVLTIAVSIAAGADAIFSFLPVEWIPYKLHFAILGVCVLTLLNMRGVKESIAPLVPIFLVFIATHLFAIIYAIFLHSENITNLPAAVAADVNTVTADVGIIGLLLILMRSYSMGAGTYTGIEAISNGMAILREPKVETAKRTMRYMAVSLAVVASGLIISYILFNAVPVEGRTLNAVLLDNMTASWGKEIGYPFVLITLISEAALLFVAAQTGFIGGPRVLANMAIDRWFPSKFSMLSDRLITQNGIMLMGGFSLLVMLFTKGSVAFLVVLYSINVFITFTISILGLVRHWWKFRKTEKKWFRKLIVSGIGLIMTSFILVSMVVVKFHDGGWMTLLVTLMLVVTASLIKRHYTSTMALLKRLDSLVEATLIEEESKNREKRVVPVPAFDPHGGTAVIFVNGFNGLGLHTLFGVTRFFRGQFKNFVFVQVGVVDAGTFKGTEEIEYLQIKIDHETDQYVSYMNMQGFYATKFTAIGNDLINEVSELAPVIMKKFPNSIFFGGQLVFPENSRLARWLHNYIVFAIQRKFYHKSIPFMILPIRV